MVSDIFRRARKIYFFSRKVDAQLDGIITACARYWSAFRAFLSGNPCLQKAGE